MQDLIERLREHAEYHKEMSYECDCNHKDTRNWQHHLTDLEAAEAQDLAGHWAIATLEAQYQLREQAEGHRKAAEFLRIERDEYRRQRDIAVAALEQYVTEEGATMLAREALKEIGESK